MIYRIITHHDPTSFIETDQGPFMSMSMNSQYDSDFTHAADKTQQLTELIKAHRSVPERDFSENCIFIAVSGISV